MKGIKEEFRNNFSNKVILKTLWKNRFAFIGFSLGIISWNLMENEILGLVATSVLAVTTLFTLAFIDYLLSMSKLGKYFKYKGDE